MGSKWHPKRFDVEYWYSCFSCINRFVECTQLGCIRYSICQLCCHSSTDQVWSLAACTTLYTHEVKDLFSMIIRISHHGSMRNLNLFKSTHLILKLAAILWYQIQFQYLIPSVNRLQTSRMVLKRLNCKLEWW
jgi:hypothetical protein